MHRLFNFGGSGNFEERLASSIDGWTCIDACCETRQYLVCQPFTFGGRGHEFYRNIAAINLEIAMESGMHFIFQAF